ncbi:putative tetratricopeptide-like helical domain superfamily [Helianthus anomalus]
MKMAWKKKNNKRPIGAISDHLPFDQEEEGRCKAKAKAKAKETESKSDDDDTIQLAQSFEAQGNKLAEVGKYHEALGKWEAAITLMPERATLHEQKAQVLLEIGETWKSLTAATRATQLEPSWAEAWVTLGRAQLNFGEPDSAIESFDTALAIKRLKVASISDKIKEGTQGCWAIMEVQARKMEVTEMRMLRWMCGHTKLDRIRNDVFRGRLEVASISYKIKEGRLRWFGHVKRRQAIEPVRVVETIEVEGRRSRGRPKITWDEQIRQDLQRLHLSENMVHHRSLWGRLIKVKDF